MTPGLSIYVSGVREAETEEDATSIEAEIESFIAEALDGHPDVTPDASVVAEYYE